MQLYHTSANTNTFEEGNYRTTEPNLHQNPAPNLELRESDKMNTRQPRNPETPGTLSAGPANFGPTAEAATPWLQLALYTAMQDGPLSVVLVCGQLLWRLPPHLANATHVLLWPWNADAVRAQARTLNPTLPFP